MIQCFTCEDWYHNSHLNPVEPSSDIDEKYLLVCRSCIKKKGSGFKEILMRNQKHFYPSIQEYVKKVHDEDGIEEPPVLKKQKVSEDDSEA